MIGIILALFLSSCALAQTQKLNVDTYYRNDICFKYDVGKKVKKPNTDHGSGFGAYKYSKKSITFCGTGVLPSKESYKLKIIGYGKINFFTLTTCHEEDTTDNPDRGIFKKNGVVSINHKPTLERELMCPMYISAYNKKNKSAFGIVVFEHNKLKLSSVTKCNGYTRRNNGVSICQSREGLIQSIEFDEEVTQLKPTIGVIGLICPKLSSKDNKKFTFKLPKKECIYQFKGKQSGHFHRFYTIGYEDIIVRE